MEPTIRGERRGRGRPTFPSLPLPLLSSPPPRVSLLLLLSLSPCLFSPALSLGEAPAYHQQLQGWSQLVHDARDPERTAAKISLVNEQLRPLMDLTSSHWRDALFRVTSSGGDNGDDALMASLERNDTTSTELCVNHTLAVLEGLSNRDMWALQMVDAMGKPSFGILDLNIVWPGGYNQCLKVRASTSVISHPLFSGRYCNLYSSPPDPKNPMGFTTVTLGLCVPDTCTSSDITLLANMVVTALNVSSPQLKPFATCEEGSRSIDAKAVVAIIICSIFGILMVVGTAVDVICIQRPQWSTSKLNGETPHGIEEPETTSSSQGARAHQDMNNPEEALLLPKHGVKAPASPPQLGVLGHVVVAFSVYTNGSKLLNTRQAPGSLTCVHGIRFLSMSWVVLGHCWGTPAAAGMNVLPYVQQIISHWAYQGILNATVSVDSFFVLSGLLVTYLTLKEMKKNGGKLNWFLFYFHRFWRLTPAYMLCIMVYVCLAPYWGYGPFWPQKFADEEFCEKNWWTNLLYVNNLVRTRDPCFAHSWYLANDMQFYILSPLIFVPFFFSPVVGMVVAFVFLLGTAIAPGAISQHYKLPPGLLQTVEGAPKNATGFNFDYFDIYYLKPYNRMGAYVVGMLAGYFLYRSNCKLRIHWVTNVSLWAFFTACALAVLYGVYESGSPDGHPLTVPVAALYNAVSRQVWAACVAWVVVACVTGNGGFVDTILSWSGMVPLSRLSYCIYLIHIAVISIFVQNQHNTFFIDDVNLVFLYLSMLVASSGLALVFSLTFEAPMMGLERVFLRRPRSEHKH